MTTTLLGIRHHGVGSARSVERALQQLQPDALVIEAPSEITAILPLLAHPDTRPPIALLLYQTDHPNQAVYYPLAEFSPEWVAIRYALAQGIPIYPMDLPQAHQLGQSKASDAEETETPSEASEPPESPLPDPLAILAEAAGFEDGERWWEYLVESRGGQDQAVFEAIAEAMQAVREIYPAVTGREALREAHMRQTLRQAQKDHSNIAVVCGAWHVPALQDLPKPTADKALLKGLPKVKVSATLVPWTFSRLSRFSGYGAGIDSPGWYAHLWQHPSHIVEAWMVKVAQLLRQADVGASSAHIIEAVRLSQTLAALRGQPLAGLPELNEAILAVFCAGNPLKLKLIEEKLIISDCMGQIPAETPSVPLLRDFEQLQRSLRMPIQLESSTLELDLRKPLDLGRSSLLHRLSLLNVPWGTTKHLYGKKGSFHEHWDLKWAPEYTIRLIEAAGLGQTVQESCQNTIQQRLSLASLPELSNLLNLILLADLPQLQDSVLYYLSEAAATQNDIDHLLGAFPPLVQLYRYGNVRQSDFAVLVPILAAMLTRITIGLRLACSQLSDDAAQTMLANLNNVHQALKLVQQEDWQAEWHQALMLLSQQNDLHGLIAGRVLRWLWEAEAISRETLIVHMQLALSASQPPLSVAHWLEGWVAGSAAQLIHDPTLWNVLDEWLTLLNPEHFIEVLPLLRRTFSSFSAADRQALGTKASQTAGQSSTASHNSDGHTAVQFPYPDQVWSTFRSMWGLAPVSKTGEA